MIACMRYLWILLLAGCSYEITPGSFTGKIIKVEYDPYNDRTHVFMEGMYGHLSFPGQHEIGSPSEMVTVRWNRDELGRLTYVPTEEK